MRINNKRIKHMVREAEKRDLKIPRLLRNFWMVCIRSFRKRNLQKPKGNKIG